MSAFVGLDSFLAYAATAGATGVSIGRVESAELNPDQETEHLTGAGGDDEQVYGMISPQGSASLWLQNDTILGHLQKTVINALPPVIGAMDGGNAGDLIKRHESCYVNTWQMALEKGGAVKLDIEWLALTHTTSSRTVGPTALAKSLLFLWHTAGVTLAGSAWNCQAVNISCDQGLVLDTDLDTKTEGVERQPTVIKPGNSKITVEIDFATGPTVDFTSATPTVVALAFKASNKAGEDLLVTLENIQPIGLPIPIASGEDEIVYKFTGKLDYNDLASLTYGIG